MTGITPADQWRPIEEEYHSLLNRPLLPAQARRLESLAVRLGKRLEWYHIDVNAHRDKEWKPGRAKSTS